MTIASLFANTLVIKHDNPDDPGSRPRTAIVNYTRPDTIAFFGSIWKTLLAGIKPCAGVDKKMQENIKTEIADQKQKKEQRQEKKAERKERRAERRLKRELKKEQKEQQAAQSP
jgi:F0F1-type ATP synthase membrane subunit b/b'